MAVVTLTFTSSTQELSDGIPKYVTIESNVPSTIYYTLDGTTPTTASVIYTTTIEIEGPYSSLTISAFGVDSNGDSGSILSQTWSPDSTGLKFTRREGNEGLVINRYGLGEDYVDGYDADGLPGRFVDIDLETLHMLKIRTEHGLNGIAPGTEIEVGIPDPSTTASLIDDGIPNYSTPEIGELFNPYARLIEIDNRKDNDINITLRPYGSLSNPYTDEGGQRIRESADDANLVTGGLIRSFYDSKNNIMVSYYYDNYSNRWVRNIQTKPTIAVSNFGGNYRQPLVFPWIYKGKPSSY
jgi:hypothetical protein